MNYLLITQRRPLSGLQFLPNLLSTSPLLPPLLSTLSHSSLSTLSHPSLSTLSHPSLSTQTSPSLAVGVTTVISRCPSVPTVRSFPLLSVAVPPDGQHAVSVPPGKAVSRALPSPQIISDNLALIGLCQVSEVLLGGGRQLQREDNGEDKMRHGKQEKTAEDKIRHGKQEENEHKSVTMDTKDNCNQVYKLNRNYENKIKW